MLRDDLALLKMAWLNQAMSRYDTLNEVARDAARVLPLLQQEFTTELGRTTTTGAIDKSVMEGEAARRAAAAAWKFGLTATEISIAESLVAWLVADAASQSACLQAVPAALQERAARCSGSMTPGRTAETSE